MAKKLCIKTYGCQMNVYDSARMADVLAPLGYERIGDPSVADMIIVNTCHIREKAAEKVYSELGRLNAFKRAANAGGGRMILAVAGCVAQAEGEEILRRAPYVDIVFGPQSYHRLPEMVARAARSADSVLDTEFPAVSKFDALPEVNANTSAVTAFLTAQEGCDKFCTFCVVPYTRGAEFSRPARDVLAEARRNAELGVREITLLGQNVNAYHGEAPTGGSWSLARLIRAIAEIPGIERIRYTTSHPLDMSDDLIAAHRDVPALMPYLHLPIQSGSDRILAAMQRKHAAADYLRLVERLRAGRPDLALSSDFIVGFPGETERDFRETLNLVEDVRFAQAFSFKYSARPGTPASLLAQVDARAKEERLSELQERLDAHQKAFNAHCVGRVLPVLFEGRGRHPGQLAGRSPYLQPVHVHGHERYLKTIVPVRIVEGLANSLAGTVVEKAAA